MKFTAATLFMFLMSSFLYSVKAQFPYEDAGVDCIDIPKYVGNWYELVTTRYVRNTIERDCRCTQAYYAVNPTNPRSFRITNACLRGRRWSYATGSAVQTSPVKYPGQFDATLTQFPWSPRPFPRPRPRTSRGKYIVLKLWKDNNGNYEHALVGGSDRRQLWLLGRTPAPPSNMVLTQARRKARCEGYTVNNWVNTEHVRCRRIPRRIVPVRALAAAEAASEQEEGAGGENPQPNNGEAEGGQEGAPEGGEEPAEEPQP